MTLRRRAPAVLIGGAVALSAVAAAVALGVWRDPVPRDADEGTLEPRTFTLGEREVTIDLPGAAAMTSLSLDRVAIDFRPGGRSSNRILLSATPPDPAVRAALQNALSAYRDWEMRPSLAEGGSGGPEASLDGWVSLYDGGRLQFSCVTQGDWIDISAAHWCEPFIEAILDHLDEAASTSATEE